MNLRILIAILSTAALSIPAGAQMQRRAAMVGGGNGVEGRCTGEVVVDGAADLQIQGDTATVRDLSGAQPRIQRFECTSALPPNVTPRVTVNGRGNSQVMATPANGGPEVIRIQDDQAGASVYQFQLSWNSGGYNQGYVNQGYGNQGYDQRYYPPPATERRETERGRNGFGTEQAINVCRDAIREQAMEQYGGQNVTFEGMRMDSNPGRNDWVVGTVDVRNGWRTQRYPFSCSVNFDTGRVRSAQINAPNQGYAARDAEAGAMDSCRSAVMDKMGTGRVDFRDMNMDPDGDLVRGSARARGQSWGFSCRVSPYGGNVRDVNVWRQ